MRDLHHLQRRDAFQSLRCGLWVTVRAFGPDDVRGQQLEVLALLIPLFPCRQHLSSNERILWYPASQVTNDRGFDVDRWLHRSLAKFRGIIGFYTCDAPGCTHGARYGRRISLLASSSPITSCFCASQRSSRPRAMDIFARMQLA